VGEAEREQPCTPLERPPWTQDLDAAERIVAGTARSMNIAPPEKTAEP
jgi:hypothetical protein